VVLIESLPVVPAAPFSYIPKNTPGLSYPITPVAAADEPAVPAVPAVPVCPIAIYGSVLPPAITIFANGVFISLTQTLIVFFTNDSSNIAILAATKNSSSPKYCQYGLSTQGAAEPTLSGC